MLDQIKLFFEKHLALPLPAAAAEAQLQQALVALFMEMMTMDDVCQETERTAILSLTKKCFSLSTEQAEHLMANAEQKRQHAVDYYEFTSLINKRFSPGEKVGLIQSLWQIAYADGQLDPQEEYLVRKIADLLGVSHTDFIMTKLRVNGKP
ncbi:TerB family tellurite resistance protein [Methylomonas koyamae]|uniref:tellurite resistance TerB family protein n=1 Tax=Methylomonas koyamae TaxID=702114 RepID=UPI001126EF73|nr:TerB family tellurite resistance protein [Methylomonas koyamae]TPQ25134.1 TerB family tellurite resistance protein [Methylomonas koyamae]